MKAKLKYRIFWSSAVILAALVLAYLIVPPLLPMSEFKAVFARALSNEIGAEAEIGGDVRLSLLGYPMLSAENVRLGSTNIKSVRFRIAWASVLDLPNAKIISGIKVSGLDMEAGRLALPSFGKKILISDSKVGFMGKDYEIIDGVLDTGRLSARVRTDRHKYSLDVSDGEFVVRNPNEGLVISGRLMSDEKGNVSAKGTFMIDTPDANRWFEFSEPRIRGRTKLTMDFVWDGNGFFDFSNIRGQSGAATFAGQIKVWHEDGKQVHKSVRLRADNAGLDLTFLGDNPAWLYNSDFNVVINGDIKTPLRRMKKLKHLSVRANSNSDAKIDVRALKAGDGNISVSMSGKIADGAAENLDVAFHRADKERSVRCVLSGNMESWNCGRWSFADKNMNAAGTLSVMNDDFKMTVDSKNMSKDSKQLDAVLKHAGGRSGTIDFKIGEMEGRAELRKGSYKVDYVEKNVRLSDLKKDLPLPESMQMERGNIAAEISGGKMSFNFQAPDWSFGIDDDGSFSINHRNAKKLLADMAGGRELPFMRPNVPVVIAGMRAGKIIADLRVQIADMEFFGMMSDGGILLRTKILDLDGILDEKWFDGFIDNQYLSGDPILTLFDIGGRVALSADSMKINGISYDGFLYSLDSDSQKMSIADSENGKLLLSISKDRSKYKYLIQSNKFFVSGKLFGKSSPVNLERTIITAEAELETFGLTAYDVRRNMTGLIDASFDGGIITGLGTDGFYDNAARYGKKDAEDALSAALSGGGTVVKEMRITGEYSGGDFRTTRPFMLTARHVDITGNFSVRNGLPVIRANIVLRGTSPVPKPVQLMADDKGRRYSLSEILRDLDLDYLREFVRTHKKF